MNEKVHHIMLCFEKVHNIMLCFQITDNWLKIPKHFLVSAMQIYTCNTIFFKFGCKINNPSFALIPYEFIISKHRFIIYFLKRGMKWNLAWDLYRQPRCLFLIFFYFTCRIYTVCHRPFFSTVFFFHTVGVEVLENCTVKLLQL